MSERFSVSGYTGRIRTITGAWATFTWSVNPRSRRVEVEITRFHANLINLPETSEKAKQDAIQRWLKLIRQAIISHLKTRGLC